MNDAIRTCDSILSLACLPHVMEYEKIYFSMLQKANESLLQSPHSEKEVVIPVILNSQTALKYNSWYLNSNKTKKAI